MKKNYTYIALVLDKSGSMAALVNTTIETTNKFINDQKETAQSINGRVDLMLVLFSDEYSLVSDDNIENAILLSHENYKPDGCTALLDAIGYTTECLGNKLNALPENERPSKVLVAIMTDGQENASKKFTRQQIFDLIKNQTNKYSWEYVYLGANQDAIATATSMGMSAGNAMTYGATQRGIKTANAILSAGASSYQCTENYTAGSFFKQP